jgi:hypothetical protein
MRSEVCGHIDTAGVVSNQRLVGWAFESAGNPSYGIPAQTQHNYIGFQGQDIIIGYWQGPANGGSTYSSAQSLKNYIGITQTYTKYQDAKGIAWCPDTNQPQNLWNNQLNPTPDYILSYYFENGVFSGLKW